MAQLKIRGKMKYQNIGTGFWGIMGDDDEKWKPTITPEELQKEDLVVEVTAKELEGAVSMFMWGKTIEIVDYSVSKS